MADQWQSTSDHTADSPAGTVWQSTADHQAPTTLMEDVGDTLKQYWDKINPVTAAQSLATTARHPVDAINSYGKSNSDLWKKASDSFKKGDYSEGIRHTLGYFLNGIPGVGAALDSAGDKAGSGDVKGAIADTAALATQLIGAKALPTVTDALTRPGLGGDIAAAAGGAVKGAAKAAIEPVHFGRYGVKLPVPAPLASAGAGGLAAHYAGLPTEVGSVIGGAVPIIKGAVGGAQEAIAARAAATRAAMTTGTELPEAAAVAPSPVEPIPLPPSRQLPASSVIVPEAPPDTSGIIPGWKPTILENENAPKGVAAAPVEPTAAPLDEPSTAAKYQNLLDGIAQVNVWLVAGLR